MRCVEFYLELLAQQSKMTKMRWLFWCIPLFVASFGLYSNAACTTPLFIPFAVALAFLINYPAQAIKHALGLDTKDIGIDVRAWKLVHHAFIALNSIWHFGCDWTTQPPAGFFLRLLYGYQFWAWTAFAVLDPLIHDTQSGEYVLYAFHHALTIGLIASSSFNGYEVGGAIVMCVMDITDVAYSAVKLTALAGLAEGIQLAAFLLFAGLWVVFRLWLFTTAILLPGMVAIHNGTIQSSWLIAAVGGCLLLQVLNLQWTYKIAKAAMKKIAGSSISEAGVAVLQTKKLV